MSVYSKLQALFKFKDTASYNKARAVLLKGKWINKEGYLLNEDDDVAVEDVITAPQIINSISFIKGTEVELIMKFPLYLSRNIHYPIEEIEKLSNEYLIVSTCTDGMFNGWVSSKKSKGKAKVKSYDLAKYSKDILKIKPIKYSDKNSEKHYDWSHEVVNNFHSNFWIGEEI